LPQLPVLTKAAPRQATAFLVLTSSSKSAFSLLSLGVQGWLEAEEQRSPSHGCTQMETSHNIHFLTPVETLLRNHASSQRRYPQEPTNKSRKVVHTKSSQWDTTCLEKTALIHSSSTSLLGALSQL